MDCIVCGKKTENSHCVNPECEWSILSEDDYKACIKRLISTITTQADMIQRLKEDGERLAKRWWESHNDETISCRYCGLQQSNFENKHTSDCPITLHNQLMQELEKREG